MRGGSGIGEEHLAVETEAVGRKKGFPTRVKRWRSWMFLVWLLVFHGSGAVSQKIGRR